MSNWIKDAKMWEVDLEEAMRVLNILADNDYSPFWDLIDDFMVNGHIVRIKDSNQFGSIIIDDCYRSIKNCGVYYVDGKKFDAGLEAIKYTLGKEN